jgi:hypothetical protein
MRFKYLLILMILLLATNSFAAEREMFGIGVLAGVTDGITVKSVLRNGRAPFVSFGSETPGDTEYQIYGDNLFYKYDFIKVPEGKRSLYSGAGAQYITPIADIGKNKNQKIGFRFPVGNEHLFWKSSSDAFLELVPVLNSTPDTKFQFGGGIGIKFFF